MHKRLLMHFRREVRQPVPFLQADWSVVRSISTGNPRRK
jgi:hypothetical protein